MKTSLTKKSKVKYTCQDCGYKFEIEYTGWYPTRSCIKCGGLARMDGLDKVISNIFIKKYKEPVAFMKDQKGNIYAVDKHGKKFDPGETRYDLKKDPHGWKAVGYKVRE